MKEELHVLSEYLDQHMFSKLEKKHSHLSRDDLANCLVELIKYLILSTYTKSLFFPYNKDVDELWHSLICETHTYQKLCDTISPGLFIHHTGMVFEEYASNLTLEEVHNEQLSWLASYVHVFGPMPETAFKLSPLAQYLANKLGIDRPSLISLATDLTNVFRSEAEFHSMTEYFSKYVIPKANELDVNPRALKDTFEVGLRTIASLSRNLDASDVEEAFSVSGALGFLFLQYQTATERIRSTPWCDVESNRTLLESGEILTGLATTHLSQGRNSPLLGVRNCDGWIIEGRAPWVSGYRIFSHIIVGFVDNEDHIVQAIVKFSEFESGTSRVQVSSKTGMNALESTSTVAVKFSGFHVKAIDVVSRRPLNHKGSPIQPLPPPPYSDLGLAKAALTVARDALLPSTMDLIETFHLKELEQEYHSIKALFSKNYRNDWGELVALKDDFIHRAIRLATIYCKGKSVYTQSTINRIYRESIFIDATYQPPTYKQAKLGLLTKGSQK